MYYRSLCTAVPIRLSLIRQLLAGELSDLAGATSFVVIRAKAGLEIDKAGNPMRVIHICNQVCEPWLYAN